MIRDFSWAESLRGKRGIMLSLLDDPRLMAEGLASLGMMNNKPALGRWRDWAEDHVFWNTALSEPVRLRAKSTLLRLMEKVGPIDKPGPWPDDVKAEVDGVTAKIPERLEFFGFQKDFANLKTIQAAGDRHRRKLTIAQYVLRVVRHRAKTGKMPVSLDAVHDAELPTMRLDIFGGTPPTYRIEADGLVVGYRDETDEGPPKDHQQLRQSGSARSARWRR